MSPAHGDRDRDFLDDFAALSRFGATAAGGVDRQAGTPEHAAARSWFVTWLEHRGFTVHVDEIGNLFGAVELTPGAPFVLIGSHLDSQPLGGRFDGAYGVLAAAHAAARVIDELRASGEHSPVNIAVVDWFNEEGCRFRPSMMGSAVFTGKLDLDSALAVTDQVGVSVAQALAGMGGPALGRRLDVAAYAELHIEQGRGLEESGTSIGVVEATWCAYKYEVVVRGEQSHTGSTRMADRRDALLGAARVVVAVGELAERFPVGVLHSSVGELHVLPNSPVVVAREVRFLMDIRALRSEILNEAYAELQSSINEIAARTRVSIEVRRSSVWESSTFDEDGVALALESARSLGFSAERTLTLAGHDATNLKETTPTVLLFVPSVDGISHNEREYTSDADLLAGVDVLADVVRRMVSSADDS